MALWMAKISGCATLVSGSRSCSVSLNSASFSDQPAICWNMAVDHASKCARNWRVVPVGRVPMPTHWLPLPE